jgi:hypothetical protein
VTIDDLTKAASDARDKAYAAARRLLPPGNGHLSLKMVDAARLSVLETTLTDMIADSAQYPGTIEEKRLMSQRDYWETVLEQLKKT